MLSPSLRRWRSGRSSAVCTTAVSQHPPNVSYIQHTSNMQRCNTDSTITLILPWVNICGVHMRAGPNPRASDSVQCRRLLCQSLCSGHQAESLRYLQCLHFERVRFPLVLVMHPLERHPLQIDDIMTRSSAQLLFFAQFLSSLWCVNSYRVPGR